MHYYSEGKIGDALVKTPFILGHECAGTVTEIGEGAEGFCINDKVVVEPGIPCGECSFCKQGKYNICEKLVFMATPPYDGAFKEYISYPSKWVFKMLTTCHSKRFID